MLPRWIILTLHVAFVVVSLSEAGKKGIREEIIVINNQGGGKCGGSAKTIVKTGGQGKKGKGSKGKGHTIIASSGGGGGCQSSCKCSNKIVHIPVPVPVHHHGKHGMDRRDGTGVPVSPISSGFEPVSSGSKMMPVFVHNSIPIQSFPQQGMFGAHGDTGYPGAGGSQLTIAGSYASGYSADFSGGYGDPGMADTRTMFTLIPQHQNHLQPHHGYSGPQPHHHAHHAHHHHHHHQHQQHLQDQVRSGPMIMQNSLSVSHIPIYEPIRPEEDPGNSDREEGKARYFTSGPGGAGVGGNPGAASGSGMRKPSQGEDDQSGSQHESAFANQGDSSWPEK